ELDLADGAERFRAIRAIHRAAIDIDGGDDVVAGSDVRGHFLDHVAQPAAVPEMVMRIDDWTGGIDDFLGRLLKPVLARIGIEPAFRGGRGAGGHRLPLCYRLPFLLHSVRLRAKSMMAALTSSGRSCWVQWPQPASIWIFLKSGTNCLRFLR